MDINKKYKELTANKFRNLNVKVVASIAKPTESDYTKGYVIRYFTQKSNDISAPIFEISNIEFSKLASSVLYTTTTLRWRITGPKEPVRNENGKLIDKGVRISNETTIKLASTNIKKLNLYLPNLFQFYRK